MTTMLDARDIGSLVEPQIIIPRKRCSQGATLLVSHPVQSWALDRALPNKVGARP